MIRTSPSDRTSGASHPLRVLTNARAAALDAPSAAAHTAKTRNPAEVDSPANGDYRVRQVRICAPVRLWYRFCRVICRVWFVLFFRGRVFHAERVPPFGGALIVANHQSFLDPVLATFALDRECHYMARDTLFRNPLFRRLIESLNAFPVKRGSADLGAIKEMLRRLRNKQVVVAFPEGTRTPDGTIGRMLSGVVIVARKAGVPIIPTVILGAFEAWPRNAPLPEPAPIVVAYGEPIQPAEFAALPDDDAIRLVRERILELARRYAQHSLLTIDPRLYAQRSGADVSPAAVEEPPRTE